MRPSRWIPHRLRPTRSMICRESRARPTKMPLAVPTLPCCFSNTAALPTMPQTIAQVHSNPQTRHQSPWRPPQPPDQSRRGPRITLNNNPSDPTYGRGKHGIRWCYTTTVALQDGLTTPTCTYLHPSAASHGACAEAMSTTACTCRTPKDCPGRLVFFPSCNRTLGRRQLLRTQRHILGYQPPPAAA